MPNQYDPNAPGVLGARTSAHPHQRIQRDSEALFDYGQGLSQSGIAGIDDLDSRLTRQLDSGGLTPEMARIFEMGRGRIADGTQRNLRSARTRLMQFRRQTGGSLSPEAIAELSAQSEQEAGQQEFEAHGDLRREHAEVQFASIRDLLDRIERARTTKLNAGQQDKAMALQARLAELDGRRQSREAKRAALAQVFSSFLGGGR